VPDPPAGHDVVFEIDVHGAEQIRHRYPDAVLIFVDAPSDEAQEARLRGRGDPEEKVQARLAKAAEEKAKALELDMTFVINDELDHAVGEIQGLIGQCRSATHGC
jgi:guanylate kinase